MGERSGKPRLPPRGIKNRKGCTPPKTGSGSLPWGTFGKTPTSPSRDRKQKRLHTPDDRERQPAMGKSSGKPRPPPRGIKNRKGCTPPKTGSGSLPWGTFGKTPTSPSRDRKQKRLHTPDNRERQPAMGKSSGKPQPPPRGIKNRKGCTPPTIGSGSLPLVTPTGIEPMITP